jgi:hypothetical protein
MAKLRKPQGEKGKSYYHQLAQERREILDKTLHITNLLRHEEDSAKARAELSRLRKMLKDFYTDIHDLDLINDMQGIMPAKKL